MLGHITDLFGQPVSDYVLALTKNVMLAGRAARSQDMMNQV